MGIVKIAAGILYLLVTPVITIMLGMIGLAGVPFCLLYSTIKDRRKLMHKLPALTPVSMSNSMSASPMSTTG